MKPYIYPTANVSPETVIGDGTKIWHEAQIRERVQIGQNCILSKGVYVDFEVVIGDNCKLQNGVFIYHGATLADGVFLGPGVMLLNDKNPRAINPDGSLKSADDWQVSPTKIGYGAGIGGGAVILPGVSVGQWAIVGSGSVVTKNVPDYGMVYGNPARLFDFVCPCGQRLKLTQATVDTVELICSVCQQVITLPLEIYRQKIG